MSSADEANTPQFSGVIQQSKRLSDAIPRYNIDTDPLPTTCSVKSPLRIQLTFVIVLEKECLEYDHVNKHHNYLNALNAIQ